MKYRKKPIVIEAIQWTGERTEKINNHLLNSSREVTFGNEYVNHCIFIHTLEGVMRADVGDWIIEGVKGELYPCKPDIFDETYEKVE